MISCISCCSYFVIIVSTAPDLGLPHFLVREGGLNSGFMIAQCTAAALVSENKTLVHPASCDSIPTSAAQEDHVSMGAYAARKVLQVVENVEKVLAIELLAAVQGYAAFDFVIVYSVVVVARFTSGLAVVVACQH